MRAWNPPEGAPLVLRASPSAHDYIWQMLHLDSRGVYSCSRFMHEIKHQKRMPFSRDTTILNAGQQVECFTGKSRETVSLIGRDWSTYSEGVVRLVLYLLCL
jgi:hypothetical protein